MYEASKQTASVQGIPNTGVDQVPGTIIKLVFVELAQWNAYTPAITETTVITSAFWTAFLATVDKTHVVTGFIDAFDVAETEGIMEGGNDNTTYNGVPRLRSITHAVATGKISGISNAEAAAIRSLTAKSGNFQQGARVGVLFLHEGNGLTILTGAKPMPVFNVRLFDPKMGGLGASDDYSFKFEMEGGWSFTKKTLELAFVGATLTNPAP
ncbi:hypothetical protein SD10_09005 [Spirosoma radiotolerans]|uniref:Uncharacterized protein n=1 Tax=Spirosoma radiotolerans TaxID=1379870 RepID=A0A0E3ZVC1_9BACT|nr:hypothetical protein SD10_09005 [Spirosoma radiotolerans]